MTAPKPNGCATAGCRQSKQPGWEFCAECLTAAVPPNARENMVIGYVGRSVEGQFEEAFGQNTAGESE